MVLLANCGSHVGVPSAFNYKG